MNDVEIVKYRNAREKLDTIKNKIIYLNSDIEKLNLLIQKNVNVDDNCLYEKKINMIGKILEDILQNLDNSIVSINSKLNP